LQLLRRQPDRRKAFSTSNFKIKSASRRSCFCFLGSRPESLPDDRPGIRFPALPEVHEPLHRSRGFDPHTHRAWKLGIQTPARWLPSCFRVHAHYFPRCGLQHCHDCWRACKSHPIILISASFGPSAVRVNTEQFTRAVGEPASLWQSIVQAV